MGGGGEGRKRYSSSFGHRYKDSLGGASEVSAGSAERKERGSDKGEVRTSFCFTCDQSHS
jgi:autophagy-related protein 13